MSVSMIMYKVEKLDEDDRRMLNGGHIEEVACLDGDWEYKFYSKEEVDRNPERFSEILKFARPVELRRTITNHRQCYIDHGMPEDVKYYSSSYRPWGIVLNFNNKNISIPRETLDRYSREETCQYFGYKRLCIEADLSNWYARQLINTLEEKLKLDLSYHPLRVEREVVEEIWRTLLKTYDEGDLYPSDDLLSFMCETMRCMLGDGEEKVFIEFQD